MYTCQQVAYLNAEGCLVKVGQPTWFHNESVCAEEPKCVEQVGAYWDKDTQTHFAFFVAKQ